MWNQITIHCSHGSIENVLCEGLNCTLKRLSRTWFAICKTEKQCYRFKEFLCSKEIISKANMNRLVLLLHLLH